MNRRSFIGITTGAVAGVAASVVTTDTIKAKVTKPTRGPYSIEIVSPPQEAARELPLFDTYKQAENWAQARMWLLRSNGPGYPHEAGLVKVWTADNQLVFECAWGETWTQATSYVGVEGRLS